MSVRHLSRDDRFVVGEKLLALVCRDLRETFAPLFQTTFVEKLGELLVRRLRQQE